MKITKIREGTTELYVPQSAVGHRKGPGSSKSPVFFNPVMEFSRDISILVLREFVKGRKKKLLDGLAATGARGIRIANEVAGDFGVVANDHNPKSVKVIKKNIKANSLTNCESTKRKLNSLLAEEGFDYIDIDPFGSPVSFLDSSMQAIHLNGMIAVTATDTAPLCGSFQRACQRRYDARPLRTSFSKELGARILAGHCIRQAAKYEVALRPVLTFFADHYIRLHFEVKKGARRADSVLNDMGYLVFDPRTKARTVAGRFPGDIGKSQISGPMWLGNIHDAGYLKKMKLDPELGTTKRLNKYLELWREEAGLPPFFYDVNEISSLTKVQPWSVSGVIEKLKEQGFTAARTHFSPTGFKTDAEIDDIMELVRQ